jgi:FOG: HPt domain
MSDDLPIDPEAIENLRSLTPDDPDGFLREIVGIFLEDTPARIAELRDTLAAGDQVAFTRAAHSIKGSAANLGANQLRTLSSELEQQSKTAGLAGIEPQIDGLQAAFERARAELGKYISG